MLDSFHYESTDSEIVSGPAVQDSQLKEDLADAMRDCAPVAIQRESGKRIFVIVERFGYYFFFFVIEFYIYKKITKTNAHS